MPNEVLITVRGEDRGMKSTMTGAGTQAGRLNRAFGGLGRQIASTATGFLAAQLSIAGVQKIILSTVGAAIKFEDEMTKINTLVGISSSTTKEWEGDLLKISLATTKGPQELAKALFVITSAGERGSGALEILESAAKASAVGLGDTAQIARVVTAAMQAWGPEALNAGKATDILMATVREGNLDAASLAASIGQVLGIAAQVGVTFADVGAFIATFTRLGVDASIATTSLRSVLSLLIKPSADASKALAEAGTSMGELRAMAGEQGLAATLNFLVQKFEGNEEALARVIPNIRALGGVLGTSGVQGDRFIEITESINESLGLTNKAFEETTKTSGFQFRQSMTELNVQMLAMGNTALPVLTAALDGMKLFLEDISTTVEVTVKAIVFLGEKVGELATLIEENIGEVSVVWTTLQDAAEKVGKVFDDVFGVGGDIINAVGSAVSSVENEVTNIVSKLGPVGEAVNEVGEFFGDVFGIGGVIASAIEYMADKAAEEVEAIIKPFRDVLIAATEATTWAFDKAFGSGGDIDKSLEEAEESTNNWTKRVVNSLFKYHPALFGVSQDFHMTFGIGGGVDKALAHTDSSIHRAADSFDVSLDQIALTATDTGIVLTTSVKEWIDPFVTFEEHISEIMDDVGTAITDLLPEIDETFDEWTVRLTRLEKAYVDFEDNLRFILKGLVDANVDNAVLIIRALEDAGPEITAEMALLLGQGPVDATKAVLGTLGSIAHAEATNMIGEIADAIVGESPQIAALLAEMGQDAIDEWSYQPWHSAGERAAKGVAAGFESVGLQNTLALQAQQAIARLEGEWRMESPSKVFEEVGVHAAQGLLNGFSTVTPGMLMEAQRARAAVAGYIDGPSQMSADGFMPPDIIAQATMRGGGQDGMAAPFSDMERRGGDDYHITMNGVIDGHSLMRMVPEFVEAVRREKRR